MGTLALWLLLLLPEPWFVDRASESGLDFQHFNGMSGELYVVELLGAGGALFDYDNDGDLDVYAVQGSVLGPGKTLQDAVFPPRMPPPLTDRLYRNDLAVAPDGTRTLRFTDVTAQAGIVESGYGMGAAAADYDNDGWVDLYVTNFGENRLWRNNGDGTFADATQRSGTAVGRWSSSASFLDYDRDGWLDLYVANYLDWSFETHRKCKMRRLRYRDYCGPLAWNGEPDRLFRNRGDGSFEDVSERAGIAKPAGKSLGVTAADFDGDGWLDLYVANDTEPNFLWRNQRDGSFREDGLAAGCAVSGAGMPQGSMGVEAGDVDGDGDEDLYTTNLYWEGNTLYLNDGRGGFQDRTETSRAGPLGFTSFGVGLLDFDNDARLDFAVVSGAVNIDEEQLMSGDEFPFHQPRQLLRNAGGRFEDAGAAAGPDFERSEVGRGLAVGDVDNDGDSDLLVFNNNGPARLLLNQAGQDRAWLGLRLLDAAGRSDRLGARVTVVLRDGTRLHRRVRSDGSYCSANDPRVLVGLGEAAEVERVQVLWPGGRAEQWPAPPLGRYTTLREGTGRHPG